MCFIPIEHSLDILFILLEIFTAFQPCYQNLGYVYTTTCTKNVKVFPLRFFFLFCALCKETLHTYRLNTLYTCVISPSQICVFVVYTETLIMVSFSKTYTLEPVSKSLHFHAPKTPLLGKWTAKTHLNVSVFIWKLSSLNGP